MLCLPSEWRCLWTHLPPSSCPMNGLTPIFSCPVNRASFIDSLQKPSLEAVWSEQLLVPPIRPKLFPHNAIPSRTRASQLVSQSMMAAYDGLSSDLAQHVRLLGSFSVQGWDNCLDPRFDGYSTSIDPFGDSGVAQWYGRWPASVITPEGIALLLWIWVDALHSCGEYEQIRCTPVVSMSGRVPLPLWVWADAFHSHCEYERTRRTPVVSMSGCVALQLWI